VLRTAASTENERVDMPTDHRAKIPLRLPLSYRPNPNPDYATPDGPSADDDARTIRQLLDRHDAHQVDEEED